MYSKKTRIIYWIATVWLALGMLSTGVVQLSGTRAEADFIARLGYPSYVLTLLAIWKILGTVTILIPRTPLLKEWAYAGFFFAMSGAVASHIAVGDRASEILPSVLLLILTIISWYFRSAERKVVPFQPINTLS
jgi:hypothetical protein